MAKLGDDFLTLLEQAAEGNVDRGLAHRTRITLNSLEPLSEFANLLPTIRVPGDLTLNPGTAVYVRNHGAVRAVDVTGDVVTASVTVANTTDETTIFTGEISANSIRAGQVFKLWVGGEFSTANASDTVTIKVKLGSTTLISATSSAGTVTDQPWHADGIIIVETQGSSGLVSSWMEVDLDENVTQEFDADTSVDTTAAQDLTVTAQWDNALAGNTLTLYAGWLEIKGA